MGKSLKSNYSRLSKQLKSLKKKIRKPEMKNINYTVSSGIDTAGSFYQLLTGIDAGTDKNQRVGTSINLEQIQLRWMCALGDPGYNTMRFLVVKTREPLLNIPDLFDAVSYGAFGGVYATLNGDVIAHKLYDKTVNLNQMVAGQYVTKFLKRNIKCRDSIQYVDSAGLSVQENYYMVICCDSAIAPNPRVNVVVKTFYTDV